LQIGESAARRPAPPAWPNTSRPYGAIFRCWEIGEKLNYQGRFHNFTLMTPDFAPEPVGLPLPPVALAAVGPLTARRADSVRLHGFATRHYLEEVVRPILAAELVAAGKSFAHFEVAGGGFIATGPDEAAVRAATEKLRYRVAFYGSTPAYRGVLDLHGLAELGVRLNELARAGKWGEMAPLVSDEVLDLFCARAPYEGLAEAVARRFGGLTDSITLEFLPSDTAPTRRRVIEAIQRIPHSFRGFATEPGSGGAGKVVERGGSPDARRESR
jgi:probable F420-dependent oxidoreductase